MLNDTCTRYAWHIIDRGWVRVGPKQNWYAGIQAEHYFEITSNVMSLLYSWTKAYCETKEEYLISRSILFEYLNSEDVTNKLGTQFKMHVSNFIRGHIDPYIYNALFYKRNKVRHFDHHMNTPVEGQFSGIKLSTICVKSSMNLDFQMRKRI